MSLDARLLPTSSVAFVVLADTHYMLGTAEHAGEFPSRRKQNDRIAAALALISTSDVAFAGHLGDHVQDYPGSITFEQSMEGAMRQLGTCPVPVHHVAGNTDVGDAALPANCSVGVELAVMLDGAS